MDTQTALCSSEITLDKKDAPQWVHLLPMGKINGRDGRSWVLNNTARIIGSFERGNLDLPVDYEHQGEFQQNRAITGPIPMAGWITKLEGRDNGLWGKVRWTPRAAEMICNREYRFLSPVFQHLPTTGEITRLKSVGLVSTPNLALTALNKQETTMDTAADTLERIKNKLSKLAVSIGLEPDVDIDSIIDALPQNAANASAEPDPAKYVPIAAFQELLKDRNSKIAIVSQNEATTRVETAMNKGYLTPAMRDWAIALCSQDPDNFDAFIQTATPAYSHLFETRDWGKPPTASTALNSAEKSIADQLGIDPKDMVEG